MTSQGFPKHTQVALCNGVAKFYRFQKLSHSNPAILEEICEMAALKAYTYKQSNPGLPDFYARLTVVELEQGGLVLKQKSLNWYSQNSCDAQFISSQELESLPLEELKEYQIPDREFSTDDGFFLEDKIDFMSVFKEGVTRTWQTTRDGHTINRL